MKLINKNFGNELETRHKFLMQNDNIINLRITDENKDLITFCVKCHKKVS
jgi:hypothetical protein